MNEAIRSDWAVRIHKTHWSRHMPLAIFLPLSLVLMAYYAYYWTGLTAVMLEDARYNRVKRDIDWTTPRNRSRRKSGLLKR